MALPHERDREEEALDALIVAAFRSERHDESSAVDTSGPEPRLSDEDEKALAALGKDLVSRIVSGSTKPREEDQKSAVDRSCAPSRELAGAMNRGDSEITEKARQEMEEKIKETEARRKKEQS